VKAKPRRKRSPGRVSSRRPTGRPLPDRPRGRRHHKATRCHISCNGRLVSPERRRLSALRPRSRCGLAPNPQPKRNTSLLRRCRYRFRFEKIAEAQVLWKCSNAITWPASVVVEALDRCAEPRERGEREVAAGGELVLARKDVDRQLELLGAASEVDRRVARRSPEARARQRRKVDTAPVPDATSETTTAEQNACSSPA
jgi:hypothetical protein